MRLKLSAVAFLFTTLTALAAAPRADFSGAWEFNAARSQNVGMMAQMKMSLTIQQTEASFDISSHANMQGQDYDTKTQVATVYNGACTPAHPAPLALGGTPATMSFCGPPFPLGSGMPGASTYVSCNSCGRPNVPGSPPNPNNRCDEPYPAFDTDYPVPTGMTSSPQTMAQGDRQFLHKPCMPATYRSGITSLFCYDPSAGETVADTTEQCGDHWTMPVNLTNDWKFYTVPFNSMTQQGWAKKFPQLDVQHVSVVRFTWDGGWVDYYIDQVAFYRHRADPAVDAGP